MEGYAWPGNVRELENRITPAVIMTEGRKGTHYDLELARDGDDAWIPTLKEARNQEERALVTRALQRNECWAAMLRVAEVAETSGRRLTRPDLPQRASTNTEPTFGVRRSAPLWIGRSNTAGLSVQRRGWTS